MDVTTSTHQTYFFLHNFLILPLRA